MDKRCLINQRCKEYDSLVGEVELQSTGFRCKCCKCKVNSKFNLLHLNISMHILHTVLHIFLKLPTRRICLTIQGFFIYSAPQGFIWNQHNNQHPVGLLAQLVECCTGITRSWVLISYRPEFFFSGLIFPVAQVVFFIVNILSIFISLPAVHIYDFHIFTVIKELL